MPLFAKSAATRPVRHQRIREILSSSRLWDWAADSINGEGWQYILWECSFQKLHLSSATGSRIGRSFIHAYAHIFISSKSVEEKCQH